MWKKMSSAVSCSVWACWWLSAVWYYDFCRACDDTIWVSYIYVIYIYIKWTVFVNVTTKSAQHAHARMIAIIVEKSPNSSHMYDHGFMDTTNHQAVCKSQTNPLSDSQTAEELHWKPFDIFSQQYCWLSTLLSTTCIPVQNHHGAEEFQLLDEEHSTVKREVIQKKIRKKDGKPTQTYEMGTYTF